MRDHRPRPFSVVGSRHARPCGHFIDKRNVVSAGLRRHPGNGSKSDTCDDDDCGRTVFQSDPGAEFGR